MPCEEAKAAYVTSMGKSTNLLSTGLVLLALGGCAVPADTNAPATASGPSAAQSGPSANVTPLGSPNGGPSADAAASSDLAPSVFFAPDTADLTPEARREIKAWADQLRGGFTPVTVVGHGDEHSTRDYAIALGAKRAEAVRNYLVALGVPPERVATTTFGGERPAAPGASSEAQALDRRAVLQFESLAAAPRP